MSESGELIRTASAYESLKEEIRRLRAEIMALTEERDDLRYHVCRDLKAEYDSRIGVLELRVLSVDGELRQLRRTIEYMQAAINRRQKVDYTAARERAREEYNSYEEELNRKAEDIHNSEQYRKKRREEDDAWQDEYSRSHKDGHSFGSEQDGDTETGNAAQDSQEYRSRDDGQDGQEYRSRADELKALYRKLIKRLHPDVNPNQTPETKRLFQAAVDAYQNGDLEKLREIVQHMESETDLDEFRDTEEDIEKLAGIRDTLLARRQMLMEEIAEIKSSFPYTVKDFLADEDAVFARQQELQELIRTYNEQCQILRERIERMQEEENMAENKAGGA